MDDLIRRRDVLAKVVGGGEFAFIPAEKIREIPSVDAVPVVHARWLPAEDGSARKTCSACGRIVDTFTAYTAPYCQCGCRMDGKEVPHATE